MTANVKVYWFDDGIAMIDCLCGEGEEIIVYAEGGGYSGSDRCDQCGRRYRVVQCVELIEAESDAETQTRS